MQPSIDPSAFVATGAVVVGAVSLGCRSSIWFNTVLRGDSAPITVGPDSNIQDGTIVHVDEGQPAIVGARVTVGHRAIVHGCLIEDECLIGMGAIVLSGARIGSGSLVGAGALVREGQVVPPGSLVLGAPSRVAGVVDPNHREAIRRGASHYVELSRTYLMRGFGRGLPYVAREVGLPGGDRGPMRFVEWEQLLNVLAEGPGWVGRQLESRDPAAWNASPGVGRWSASELVSHLCDIEREIYLPRLERMLGEEEPEIPDVAVESWAQTRGYGDRDARSALDAWGEARRLLWARLASLGRAQWTRVGFHSVRGPLSLGQMVRDWVEHDLAHRRQIVDALGDRR